MKLLSIALLTLAASISPSSWSADLSNVRVLPRAKAHFYRHLSVILHSSSYNPENIPVAGDLGEDSLTVLLYNPSDECLFDNFSPSCKTKKLIVLARPDSQFDDAFAIELGPAYGWDIVSVQYRQVGKPCILLRLMEQVKVRSAGGNQMMMKARDICISSRGLVR